jgi:pimeloyl-ACP methyl ester carboxylesterase
MTTVSLLGGLLAALLFAVVIFAGAKENVISGSVLLAFALGWASLAALSVLLTDQPQRWAIAPAALSAFVGCALLLWPGAVTHDIFSWIWPPTLFLLVGWMLVKSRTLLHSPARPWLLFPIFGVLALSAVAGGYETVQEAVDRGKYDMPGQLIDVGDHRLHIFCTGAGSPTVVLEPGLGEPSSMMSGWIAPDVAQRTRVCVYDRAGRGWSDAAEGSQNGVAVATDLHTLLENAGEIGPYVLAGHSLGGAYVQIFASMYPSDVAGVVLLDSMHPQQYERLPGYPAFYQTFRRVSALLPSLSRIGVGRLLAQTESGTLPSEIRGQKRSLTSTARHYRSVRDEVAEIRITLHQAGELRTLGNTSLIVLTALKDAEDGWEPLQNELAMLSSNSLHRFLADATHASLTDDEPAAGMSVQAILDVVDAVRASAPLNTRVP